MKKCILCSRLLKKGKPVYNTGAYAGSVCHRRIKQYAKHTTSGVNTDPYAISKLIGELILIGAKND